MVVITRWRKAGEILTTSYFWLTCEKVGSGFQYHHGGARRFLSPSLFTRLMDLYGISIALRSLSRSLSTRLIPAYGFCVVPLSAQPNRCTFVQSRANRSCYNGEITAWRFYHFCGILRNQFPPLARGHTVSRISSIPCHKPVLSRAFCLLPMVS